MPIKIYVAKDFTTSPGVRYRHQSDYSGEQFREEILEPKLKQAISSSDKLMVYLEGTTGYSSSFLEESFGGLVRTFGIDPVRKYLEYSCKDDPSYEDDIADYIDRADRKKGK